MLRYPDQKRRNADRRWVNRKKYGLAQLNHQVIIIQKVVSLPRRRPPSSAGALVSVIGAGSSPRRRVQQAQPVEDTRPSSPLPSERSAHDIITGIAHTHFVDRRDDLYVTNVTLRDSSLGTILQRFGPTSEHLDAEASASAKRGGALLDHMLLNTPSHNADGSRSSAEGSPLRQRLHLGVRLDAGYQRLCTTADTRQETRGCTEVGRKAVGEFCDWLQQHVDRFVVPLLGYLCPKWRDRLAVREAVHVPWVTERVPDYPTFYHALYSTFCPFRGFSDKVHIDQQDAPVSILLNFEQHAVLDLPEYGERVMLQPLDVIFLRSKDTFHRTLAHPEYSCTGVECDDLTRWAVTCFFREAIEQQIEPRIHTSAYFAASAAGLRRSPRVRTSVSAEAPNR